MHVYPFSSFPCLSSNKTESSPSPLSSCPIAGEFTGNLPDAPLSLCAKMSSDCNNPDIIFYSVFSCGNASQVFEGGEKCHEEKKKQFSMN